MTSAAARHRLLDQAAAHALGDAPGNAQIPHDFVERGTPAARQGPPERDADHGHTRAAQGRRASWQLLSSATARDRGCSAGPRLGRGGAALRRPA